MGRLVDIDEVIKVAENTFPQEDVRKIMWVLCHTPTAYDISKVVAELEEAKFLMPPENDNHYADNGLFLEDAIDIVRKGGVE